MPDFNFETPKDGKRYWPEPGELRLPIVLLIDTSCSMSSLLDEVHEALKMLGDEISADAVLRCRVDICVITYDDEARVLVPFTSMYDYEVPSLSSGNLRALHAALKLGMKQIKLRLTEYRSYFTPYYRPWMFLLTSGQPSDPDDGTIESLLEAQAARRCVFYPFGIGDEGNRDFLKTLRQDHIVLCAKDIKAAFSWMGSASTGVFCGHPGGSTILLPDPAKYGLTIDV